MAKRIVYRYNGPKDRFWPKLGGWLIPGQFIDRLTYERLPERDRMRHEIAIRDKPIRYVENRY